MKKIVYGIYLTFFVLSCSTADISKSQLGNHLLGYWSFDTIELLDSSTYKNNARNEYGIIDKGIIGNSIDLSRNYSYVKIYNQPQYNTVEKTIMFWFNKNTPTINETYGKKNVEGIIGKANDTGINREFSIAISNNKYPFNIYSNIGNKENELITTQGENLILPQKWYHIALVISKTKIQFYLNGEMIKENQLSSLPITNNSDIFIGKAARDFEFTRYFNGKIDELYIYDKPLEKGEINKFYLSKN